MDSLILMAHVCQSAKVATLEKQIIEIELL